jgi:hypothetical protein
MKDVSPAHMQGFREDIDLYTEIRKTIAGLMDTLREMNTFPAEKHCASGFAELIEAVMTKLAE